VQARTELYVIAPPAELAKEGFAAGDSSALVAIFHDNRLVGFIFLPGPKAGPVLAQSIGPKT